MRRQNIFIVFLLLSQINTATIFAQDCAGNTASDEADPTLSGNPLKLREALKAVKIEYFGSDAGPLCKTQGKAFCYKGGSCCSGGPKCLFQFSQLRRLADKMCDKTLQLVDFCSS